MIKDYYKLLGISNEATLKEIKKAFRRFALQYHPDRNKDENTGLKFIEITEAYEVLKDPSKRAEYDRLYTIYILNQSEPESQDSDSDFTNKWESSFNEWADFGRQNGIVVHSSEPPRLARGLHQIPDILQAGLRSEHSHLSLMHGEVFKPSDEWPEPIFHFFLWRLATSITALTFERLTSIPLNHELILKPHPARPSSDQLHRIQNDRSGCGQEILPECLRLEFQ